MPESQGRESDRYDDRVCILANLLLELPAGVKIHPMENSTEKLMSLQITPGIEIIEETKTELEPLYHVIIHNDDVTPMDFVVMVLTSIFMLGTDTATDVMFKAHVFGMAYVQTLPKTEAEKRINKAHFAAGLEGYPLHFSIEPE